MFVVPFPVLERSLVHKTAQTAVIRLLLSVMLRNLPFDEQLYLDNNPDVAAAVENGEWPDGRSHFAASGYFEGRWGGASQFSEAWYLDQYPDVREAVEDGTWDSGEQHYFTVGIHEWRCPTEELLEDVGLWKAALRVTSEEKPASVLEKNHDLYEQWLARRPTVMEPSPVALAVGTMSPKGDLIMGRGGTVFLIGGADSPLDQYGRDIAEVAPVVNQLTNLFQERATCLADRAITYLQIVIPEKLSIVPAAFPLRITVPTTMLGALEQRAADSPALRSAYISCYDLFSRDDDPAKTYRPVDTHLAPYGAFRLIQAILQRLGLEPLPALDFNRVRTTPADVSERFFGILESYSECDASWATPCEKISESRQTLGHIGKRQSWICPAAPHRQKVIVFGNSYFEFADRGQYALSWWMARLFTEYEFVWSFLDWDIVDEQKPDLVICQTVERFLHRVANN